MSIGTAAAIAIGVGAAGSVASSAIGASTAGKAASTQANAADRAAQLQYNLGEQQLQQNNSQFAQQQQNIAPWLQSGQQALGQLSSLVPQLNQEESQYGSFQAPTGAQAAATPGYQFQLQQGQQALENSAAAKGGLLTGGTAKALDQYSQGLADSTYQQTYNNAFGQYQQNYNQFENSLSNQYNRLAGLSGTGRQAANALGQLSQQNSNTGAQIASNIGSQVGANINNAGAATASGYIGAGNAVNGGIGGIQQSILLSQLLGGSNPSASVPVS